MPARLALQVTTTWSPVGSMAVARLNHQLLTLPNGDALVCGGGSAELYSPSTQTWTTTGSMRVARAGHIAVLLPSGNVLVAGGDYPTSPAVTTAEIYSPSAGTWRAAAALPIVRSGFSMVTLPSGLVLLAGGQNPNLNPLHPTGQGGANSITLLYNETADAWTESGPLLVPDQNDPNNMAVLFSSFY